jgi:hypothetical protein
MRRLGIAVAVFLLLAFGAYTAFWFYVAGRIDDGLGQWADTMRAQNLDFAWRETRISGYPLAFRIELSDALLRETAARPGGELRVPLLSASTAPWSFRTWRLVAPSGLSATAGPPGAPVATLEAGAATGSVVLGEGHSMTLDLDLQAPVLDAGVRVAARNAVLRLTVPEHPPQTHAEPTAAIGLHLQDVTVPGLPAPLDNPLDDVELKTTLMGPVPPGPPRAAAQAWRDAGGTLELDRLAIRAGALALSGSGTMALDPQLQPEAAFSGTIEGADELLAALVQAGRLRANDAGLARLALAMLAKPGTNGRPQISTSFTIQDGQMRLGPVNLGKAPRLVWP